MKYSNGKYFIIFYQYQICYYLINFKILKFFNVNTRIIVKPRGFSKSKLNNQNSVKSNQQNSIIFAQYSINIFCIPSHFLHLYKIEKLYD
jgi:hypothetical protein